MCVVLCECYFDDDVCVDDCLCGCEIVNYVYVVYVNCGCVCVDERYVFVCFDLSF